MKKTQFPNPASYSVAMSTETGCIVMVRDSGKERTICGSLTRQDSIKFAIELMEWGQTPDEPQAPQVDAVN